MRVIRYEAHNLMRIQDIRFDLEGHHLFLVGGKNGNGKTSALTALLAALCGKSGMDYPELLLKEGEDEGWVKVELSGDEELHEPEGLTVELFLKRKRGGAVVESFKILDSAGDEAPEPRTLLKKLYELRAFDPLDFERKDRKAKKEILQKLLGLDFTEKKAEIKRLYDQRTGVNRDVARLQAEFKALKKQDAPEEEVSTSQLLSQLEKAQAVNADNRKAERELATRQELLDNNEELLDKLAAQIADLEARQQAAQREHAILVQKLQEQQKTVAGLKDVDEAPIRAQMRDADSINAKVRENRKWREKKEELDRVAKTADTLSAQMDNMHEEIDKAIREAKFPVEGLSFDDDGVLFNGLPLEQASKSQRTMVSVDIGIALNPKLRLMVCQDGSDLDADTLAALDEKLKKNNFQAIVELVTRTQEDENLCAVVIENGKAKELAKV